MKNLSLISRYSLVAMLFFLIGVMSFYLISKAYYESLMVEEYAMNMSRTSNDYIMILKSTEGKKINFKSYLECLLTDEYKSLEKGRDDLESIKINFLFKAPLNRAVKKLDGDLKSIDSFFISSGVESCSIKDW